MDRQQRENAVQNYRTIERGNLYTDRPGLRMVGRDVLHTGRYLYTAPATIHLQGSLVELKEKSRVSSDRLKVKRGGARGVVTYFSKASRRRLLKYTAKIKTDQRPLFITLTYGQEYPSGKVAKENHLRAFMERTRRKFPDASGMWRLEFQARGAPHFHILLFNVAFWGKAKIQKAWAEVIGREFWDKGKRYPFTRVERIRSQRGTMYYVSKYVAKVSDDALGFNYSAYPHVGRWWGWFNKHSLPWAPSHTIRTVHGKNDVYWTFKRYLRRYKNGYHIRRGSCTAFVADAERWLRLWHDICLNGHHL